MALLVEDIKPLDLSLASDWSELKEKNESDQSDDGTFFFRLKLNIVLLPWTLGVISKTHEHVV